MDLAGGTTRVSSTGDLPLHDAHRLLQPWLLPAERVLWAGRPPRGLRLGPHDALLIPFSLVWGGFAISWTVGAWWAGAPLFFVALGLPFVAIGLYFMVGRFFHDAWTRRRTLYALTNQRVLIVRGGGEGARLTGRDLAHLSTLEIDERGRGGRGTIRFAQLPWSARGAGGFASRASVPVVARTDAFEDIERARNVYDLIRRESARHRQADA